jgi:Fur family transcriptional regulator, ferric uptake regulator
VAGTAAKAGSALRTSGYRLTKQRQLVWDTLRRTRRHLSAEEIGSALRRQRQAVDMATIYRSLDVLQRLGLIQSSRLGERQYFEIAEPGEHYHLVCDDCGRATHIEGEDLAEVLDHITGAHHFAVRSADLIVHGWCDKCQAKAVGGR